MFILIFICLLLLFYNFETTQYFGRSVNESLVLLWKLKDKKILLHIFPHNEFVLIDNRAVYIYLDKENEDTYVSAIKLEENIRRFIINFKYLFEWSYEPPKILHYPKNLTSIIDIINYLQTQ